jgi:hypothetical protein
MHHSGKTGFEGFSDAMVQVFLKEEITEYHAGEEREY